MLTLVLDTATAAVTAALASVGVDGSTSIVAQRVTVDARAHGELLAPAVAEVLTAGGIAPGELSAVVAGVGPGPFTGLRIGLVTAAALADTLNIPAYGVCTLDTLGWAVAFPELPDSLKLSATAKVSAATQLSDSTELPGVPAVRVLVATDARRHEVYWATYEGGHRRSGPAVSRPSDVDTSGVAYAVGDGALRYADVLGVPARDEPRYPPPLGLAALAAPRILAGAPAEPLTPLYLRRPDAVAPSARKPALPSEQGRGAGWTGEQPSAS